MAYAQDGALRAYPADTDLSTTGQYCAVKRTATGIALCGANSTTFLGVLIDDPKAGEPGTAKVRDVAKAKAGAAFAIDVKLTTDASGRFVTATSGQNVWAKALEAAGAADELVSVEVLANGGTAA